ncbi:MAG: GldG family protein [Lachnospiraceae bacterium]|nr:GldG family protein [Lachnospiraceae bacterium]
MSKIDRSVQFKNGSMSSILIFIAVCVFIVANLAVYTLPTSKTSFSTSGIDYYDFSSVTKNYIKNELKEDIVLHVLSDPNGQYDDYVLNLCKVFSELSGKITVNKVDTAVSPTFISNYGISVTESYSNGIIIEAKESGKSKFIGFDKLYTTTTGYDENYNTVYSYSYDGEGQLISAIYNLTSDAAVTLYEVIGNGQMGLDNYTLLSDAFEKNNITLAGSLTLANETEIPKDCDVLVIAYNTPEVSDLTQAEAQLLKDYVLSGGNIIVIFNNIGISDYPNLNSVLEYIGVKVENGFINENDSSRVYAQLQQTFGNTAFMPVISPYSNITKDLTNSYMCAFLASPVNEVDTDAFEPVYTDLLNTSSNFTLQVFSVDSESSDEENTADETDSGEDKVANKTASVDYNVAAAIAKYIDLKVNPDSTEESGHALVIGCSYFLENVMQDNTITSNNVKLLTNAVSQMTGSAGPIYVEPKTEDEKINVTTQSNVNLYTIIFIVLLPLCILLLGFTVWFIRRSK